MKYFRCVVFIVISVLFLFSCSKVQSKSQHSDLKEFKSSDIIRMIEKGKSVTIVNAIIYDDLDFTAVDDGAVVSPTQIAVEISQPIYFHNCVFMGKVAASGTYGSKGSKTTKKFMMKKFTHFRSDVCFYDCDFRKEVVFNEAIVDGNMNFSNTIFSDAASFNHILMSGTQCVFANIQAKSSFQFIYSTIRGDVNFMDARFSDSFSASSLVAKDLILNNVQIDGSMNLSEMLLSGIFMFNYGRCADDVSFAFSTYMGRFSMLETTFDGNVTFERSRFFGMVKMNHTSFAKKLELKESVFYEKPEMEDVKRPEDAEPIVVELKQSEYIKPN